MCRACGHSQSHSRLRRATSGAVVVSCTHLTQIPYAICAVDIAGRVVRILRIGAVRTVRLIEGRDRALQRMRYPRFMAIRSVDGSVTLQVNVAPSDLPHAATTLAHHLRQWRGQVDQVVYTLDLRKSTGPRGARYDEYKPGMLTLTKGLAASSPRHRLVEVDYSDEAVNRVSKKFFGGVTPPTKDCTGAPFYGYFYGLAEVETRYVLHMDCDLLFGGGSTVWLKEAIDLLRARSDVLFVCPLAGPPAPTARIPRRSRRAQRRTQMFGSEPVLEDDRTRTYRLRHVSTRIFVADMQRFRQSTPLTIMDAPPWTFGSDRSTTPYLPAETVLSRAMHDGSWLRLDYLGTAPGMWFLHPTQRGPAFSANLPNLISAIESGAVPRSQEGTYELLDDWLDTVGPARFQRRRELPTARTVLALGSRLTGARAVRNAIWRARWRRDHR